MAKKGPMKYTFSMGGVPLDLDSMTPEERKELWIKLNDNAMKALGYERVQETQKNCK